MRSHLRAHPIRRLLFKLKWWRWLLSGPNVIQMRLAGADRESIRIAMERHAAKEPKQEETK